jgi:hypothetical protein
MRKPEAHRHFLCFANIMFDKHQLLWHLARRET